MKSLHYIFILIVLLSVVGAAGIFITGKKKAEESPQACTMEALICPDGSAVGRTGPDCSFAPCPMGDETPLDVREHISSKADLIVLASPKPNATVASPLTLTGEARGSWFFEASFPIDVVDWDGRIIGSGHATADGEWMTSEFVPFTATVTYILPEEETNTRGTIILRKDNPSGLPQNDDALEIPVRLR